MEIKQTVPGGIPMPNQPKGILSGEVTRVQFNNGILYDEFRKKAGFDEDLRGTEITPVLKFEYREFAG